MIRLKKKKKHETIYSLLNSCRFSLRENIQRDENYVNEIPLHIKNKYIECFNELIPSDKILKIVNNISKNFTEKTISISIRSWPDAPERQYLFNINDFINKMKKYDNSYNFFISSDDINYIDKLKSLFKDRIIYYIKGDDTITSFHISYINILLLSKNNVIIGSIYSNYPEVAWWLSDCKSKLIIL